MKRVLCLISTIALLLGLLGCLTVSAAGSITLSADKSTVTVGSTVTITAKCDGGGKGIGSMDAYFRYDPKVFEYVSCSGVTANGGAGSLKMSYFAEGLEGPKSLTITIKLKAIAVGDGGFKWETDGMYDDEDTLLSNAGKSLSVTANNPTLSGDTTLSYLRPSKGTLTPKFDKNVTEYTVTVPHSVSRLLLNYTATDPNATTEITDNADLQVGKTTRVITVTAPNGAVKKYSVVVIREAAPSTSSTTGSDTTGTTTTTQPQPIGDELEVTVGGETMYIADSRPAAELPDSYGWDSMEVNGVEIPAAKHATAALVLLYLTKEEDAKEGTFYLYDAATDSFHPFYQLQATGGSYTVHNLPDTEVGPVGAIPGSFPIGEGSVTAYLYEDPALADYAILYLTTPEGRHGLYTYDRTDGSLQRYHAVTVPADPQGAPVQPVPQPQSGGFVTFVTERTSLIFALAAALCGLAVLIAAIALSVRLFGSKEDSRH